MRTSCSSSQGRSVPDPLHQPAGPPTTGHCQQPAPARTHPLPQGSAAVIRCLTSQRAKLSSNCRATLFDEEQRFSENIDFQFPMKKACVKEIDLFCPKVPHGNARVIRCLQVRPCGGQGSGRCSGARGACARGAPPAGWWRTRYKCAVPGRPHTLSLLS
jgi:hypothetical protein